MKKLTYLTSVVAAAFAGNAYADVSVSVQVQLVMLTTPQVTGISLQVVA